MGRELKEYPDVVVKPEELRGPIDFVRVFGRSGPTDIEIGSGKGTFLVSQAKAQPHTNFVGIEWARKYWRHAIDRVGRWGLTNVRIVRADAPVFLRDFVPEGSVDCFHVYFPDPWPKKKHHKRRFLQPSNVELLLRLLKPGGTIRIATDHADYFEQITKTASVLSDRLEEIEFPRPAGAREGELTGTNYERKYIKDGRPVYSIALRKIA
ncbi:MAG: tRNA (guanosine(46)-N7)-methyltransferase TrmB [Sedimentisphaerales bacterium]|nr:tRNA (guanosine(46)-N7)-methyltransferase TrmB [Sedimentisphaerales bacterium]